MMPATAFNPNNYQNANGFRQQQIMNYYKKVNPKVKPSIPITLSWNVNAYVKEKEDGFIKKCCSRIRCCKNEDDVAPPYNGYPYAYPYQNRAPFIRAPPPEPQPRIKHILKNGMFFLV